MQRRLLAMSERLPSGAGYFKRAALRFEPMSRQPTTATRTRVPGPEVQTAPNNLPATRPEPPSVVSGPVAAKVELPLVPPPPKIYPTSVAKGLLAVKRGLGPITMTGQHEFHKYTYPTWQDVISKLGPLLTENNILIVQSETGRNILERLVSMTYDFTIVHESGDVWPDRPQWTSMARLIDSKGTMDDQAINKCHTQAHKSFLKHQFDIRTQEDETEERGEKKPPIPSPNGTIKPHTMTPQKNDKIASWSKRFIAAISLAASIEELEEWDKLNDEYLTIANEKDKPSYDAICAAVDKRIAKIEGAAPKSERVTTAAKPVEPPIPSLPPPPDYSTSPDDLLNWIDKACATVTKREDFGSFWNKHIDPLLRDENEKLIVMKPDFDAAAMIYDKHQDRLVKVENGKR
jgi:ERF superfamily